MADQPQPAAPAGYSGPDRRDPQRQVPLPKTGRRQSDRLAPLDPTIPYLTTRDIARRRGYKDEGVILGEILDGRLKATITKPPGRQRATYRISEAAYADWCANRFPAASSSSPD